MEFKFPINDIFKNPIVEINHTLVPPGFTGDRRAYWDALGKVSEVVTAMGEASAAAQGLTKPITTAERLRNSEHKIYLLIDQNANQGRGAVTGMLKVGKKSLYVFDRNGQHYQVSPPCVLDFYIHESRQRTGLGKRLFEHMLQSESVEPVKMAIDRPSDKFLGFLNKHYTLNDPVKQMNNYVVFDGFFPSTPEKNGTPVDVSHSGGTPGKKQSANGLQTTSYTSPLGRYGAPRPACSMGQIIHNQSSTIPKNPEPTGVTNVRSAPETSCQVNNPANPTNLSQSVPNMSYQPQNVQQYTNQQDAQQNQYLSNNQSNINETLHQQQYNPQTDYHNNIQYTYPAQQYDTNYQTYQNTLNSAGIQNATTNQEYVSQTPQNTYQYPTQSTNYAMPAVNYQNGGQQQYIMQPENNYQGQVPQEKLVPTEPNQNYAPYQPVQMSQTLPNINNYSQNEPINQQITQSVPQMAQSYGMNPNVQSQPNITNPIPYQMPVGTANSNITNSVANTVPPQIPNTRNQTNSIANTVPYQMASNPNVTNSVANTVPYQMANTPNVTNSVANTVPHQMANSPNVVPQNLSNRPSQANMGEKNQNVELHKTISRANTNTMKEKNETVVNQPENVKVTLSKQQISKPSINQTPINSAQVPHHMEGTQSNNKNSITTEETRVHNDKGDMPAAKNEEIFLEHGYPPQMLNQTPRRQARQPAFHIPSRS